MKIIIKNIINDTLKHRGKWSRKSLTMFTSFTISIILGFYIVFSDYFLDGAINEYAYDVFTSFLLMAAALSGITVFDKKFLNRNTTKNNNIQEDDSLEEDKYPEA